MGHPWASKRVDMGFIFGGVCQAPLLRSTGRVTKKAPPKRGPARDPETSPLDTKDEHSFTVWTSIRAWRGGAADPLPGPGIPPLLRHCLLSNCLLLCFILLCL